MQKDAKIAALLPIEKLEPPLEAIDTTVQLVRLLRKISCVPFLRDRVPFLLHVPALLFPIVIIPDCCLRRDCVPYLKL